MPEAMTATARKKARKAAAAKALAERNKAPRSLSARETAMVYALAGLPLPGPVVIPGVTPMPAHPQVVPGDRVQLLARHNLLFPGAKGRVVQVKIEHGITSALVVLDRKNSAGLHLRVWRACLDLYVLGEGEWRRPRPRVANPEQLSAYGTVHG